MTADAKIMEALARVEHKLDLLLRYEIQPTKNGMRITQVGDQHVCPLCQNPVTYDVDITDSVVLRKCGCKTGKIALDMKAFAPVLPTTKKEQEDDGEHEDRNDPDGRPKRPGGR